MLSNPAVCKFKATLIKLLISVLIATLLISLLAMHIGTTLSATEADEAYKFIPNTPVNLRLGVTTWQKLAVTLKRELKVNVVVNPNVASERLFVWIKGVPARTALKELLKHRGLMCHFNHATKTIHLSQPSEVTAKERDAQKRALEDWLERTQRFGQLCQAFTEEFAKHLHKARVDYATRDLKKPCVAEGFFLETGDQVLKLLTAIEPEKREWLFLSHWYTMPLPPIEQSAYTLLCPRPFNRLNQAERSWAIQALKRSLAPELAFNIYMQTRKALSQPDDYEIGFVVDNGTITLALAHGWKAEVLHDNTFGPSSKWLGMFDSQTAQRLKAIANELEGIRSAMLQHSITVNLNAKDAMSHITIPKRGELQLDEFLKLIAQGTRFHVIADYYFANLLAGADGRAWMQAKTLGEMVHNICFKHLLECNQDDDFLLFKATNRPLFQVAEPPWEKVKEWVRKKYLKELTLWDIAEMASTLNPLQLISLTRAPRPFTSIFHQATVAVYEMDVLRLLHSLPTEKRKRAMETGLTKDELPPRYARMLPRLALRGKLLKGESPRIPNGGIKIWERRRKTFPPQRIIDYFVLIDPGAGEDAVIRCITNWM